MLTKMLIVAAGGVIGALARYAVFLAIYSVWREWLPLGTLVVNVLGCLAIGIVMALAVSPPLHPLHPPVSEQWRLFLAVGILGSFTTFSALGYESMVLARDRDAFLAGLNIAANVLLGLLAVWIGWRIGRALA